MLAHCVPFHPDRFWTKENIVSAEAKAEIVRAFNWTASDAAYLLKFVDDENMFHRGSIGEDIYLLLSTGWAPDVHNLFKATLDMALASGDLDIALKSLAIIQYQSGDDARKVVQAVVEQYPIIANDTYINDLILAVQENGWLDIT